MIGEGKRISRSYTMTVDASGATLFPLLCPVREYDWIDGWECTMVYSESGVAEMGCVFLTELPGRGVETCMVSRYQPPREIEFCRTAGESRVCHLRVALDDHGNVQADTDEYQTSVPKVFTAGDMRRGQSLVVWAIREGRQCARSVDQFLQGSSELPR